MLLIRIRVCFSTFYRLPFVFLEMSSSQYKGKGNRHLKMDQQKEIEKELMKLKEIGEAPSPVSTSSTLSGTSKQENKFIKEMSAMFKEKLTQKNIKLEVSVDALASSFQETLNIADVELPALPMKAKPKLYVSIFPFVH